MNVTILGSGAMACLLGARLSAAASVTLVGNWPEGLAALHDRGVLLEEAGQTRRYAVRVAAGNEASAPADLALVLVKAWQTPWAAQQLPARLTADGLALTLQNGLGNLEALGPRARLGVTTLGATLLGPGRVRAGGAGPIHVGGPGWIVKLLERAGLEAYQAPAGQVDSLLWGKLVVNCGINALTALLRIPNGDLLKRPAAEMLMNQAASECARVAAAQGVPLPFAVEAAGSRARAVAERTAINRSSMFQDILRSAPTEIEAINGAVARLGQKVGVAVPVNTTLWRLVQAAATPPLEEQP